MATLAQAALDGEFVRLANAGLGLHEYARAGVRVLRRAVAFDAMAGVWFDPETGLPVDEWIDNSLAGGAGSRLPEIGLHETDIDCVQAARPPRADRRPA